MEDFCDSICENYRCELDKGHEGYHKCGKIIWDEDGIIKKKKFNMKKLFKKRNPLRKLPPTEELKELYMYHTMEEIGEMFGVSKDAVSQQLRKINAPQEKIEIIEEIEIQEILKYRSLPNPLSWEEIADKIGKSHTYVRCLAKRWDIETRLIKPIGCENCKTHPYAKGLCRNCYVRNWKKGE